MDFNEVERTREVLHKKQRKGYLVTFSITGFFAALVIWAGIESGNITQILYPLCIVFFLIVFGILLTHSITNKEAKEYHKAYKAYFIERNLAQTFTDLTYSHEMGMPRHVLFLTGMVNTGDVYSSNDFTHGRYKDTAFAQADVHIQKEYTDSEGDKHYTTIFKGRAMIFEFPKKFTFKLELVGRRFHAYRIPGKDEKTHRKMSTISTESSEFNDAFKIYAEDGFEAFYLLDPKMISRILDISTHYKNKTLFCFVDNKLFILLDNGKDSFEPPKPNKPINEQAELARVSTDIKVITDFIDQLSLDRKLFK